MRAVVREVAQAPSPESLLGALRGEPGVVLLRSSLLETASARYSFVAARPFLSFQSAGALCRTRWAGGRELRFGDPWRLLERLLARFELRDEIDLPFPLGGCFGYWGYDLKNFLEPALGRHAINDLQLPDCQVGFYDSLVAFDHDLGTAWILSTGLQADGSRSEHHARSQAELWRQRLAGQATAPAAAHPGPVPFSRANLLESLRASSRLSPVPDLESAGLFSSLSRDQFLERVVRAQGYIRSGDIYQVNLSHRLSAALPVSARRLFHRLSDVSPAPFAAYLDAGALQLISSSPELFLRISGSQIQTRPIKGTRPRSADAARDAQLSYQLQTSAKEMAELVMITDLLRNDLGRVCEFGSVRVAELARLERYPQVQHLVSTIEGSLRPEISHLGALASCFPGGSITGAPKIRAMQIIDELEPVARGPYTGALGYLGFNGESQLSIIIRTALCRRGLVHFHTGAGIVADSVPDAEYLETMAKASGFLETLRSATAYHDRVPQRPLRP